MFLLITLQSVAMYLMNKFHILGVLLLPCFKLFNCVHNYYADTYYDFTRLTDDLTNCSFPLLYKLMSFADGQILMFKVSPVYSLLTVTVTCRK